MSPEALIYLILYLAAIVGGAWLLEYCLAKAMNPDPLPRLARFVIWGIAFLLVLIVVLRHSGMLHAAAGLALIATDQSSL